MTRSTAALSPVERWFGPAFRELHPLLQQLHRDGGRLRGPVDIRFGTGLAWLLGRRLARKLGIPADSAIRHQLQVDITHDGEALHWLRRFDDQQTFHSRFIPTGHWPDGVWTETSGGLRLNLGVEIVDGGWHWRRRALWLAGLRLPPWLLPGMTACKHIEADAYRFEVALTLPVLGLLFSYSGLLARVA